MDDRSPLIARADRYRALTTAEMRAVVGPSPLPLFGWMRYHLGWEDAAGRAEIASPGKMMRPVALLLAAELVGGDPERAVAAAASVELIHNFSLLHDDVEDASEFRRGRANLWTFAGIPQAINTGDGMLVVARAAQQRLRDAGHPAERVLAVVHELDEACLNLVRGQYLDMSFESRMDVTPDEYVEMALGKTAAMFAAPFAVGALLGGAEASVVDAFRQFGRHIGLAFQAVDDILGIWGDPAVTGKPASDDLLARKMTYPVVSAMHANGSAEPAARALREAYATPSAPGEDTTAIARLVEAAGGRARTQTMAEREEEAALDALRHAGLTASAIAACAEFTRAAIARTS